MKETNYILHLNSFFSCLYSDDQFRPTHIALYMALFQFWNQHRFPTVFSVSRSDLMQMAKIKSKTTYSKGLGDLEAWGYIRYERSNSPLARSQFSLTNIWSSKWPSLAKNRKLTGSKIGLVDSRASPIERPLLNEADTDFGPELVPIYKTSKHKHKNVEIPPEQKSVINFFLERGSKKEEALKFWNHYESIGWRSGINHIKNWKAAADKWLIGNYQNKTKMLDQKIDYLYTNKKKDYDQPL